MAKPKTEKQPKEKPVEKSNAPEVTSEVKEAIQPKEKVAVKRNLQPLSDKEKSALKSGMGVAWLIAEAAKADNELKRGPKGQGWQYNELLREGVVETADFVNALLRLVDITNNKEKE